MLRSQHFLTKKRKPTAIWIKGSSEDTVIMLQIYKTIKTDFVLNHYDQHYKRFLTFLYHLTLKLKKLELNIFQRL